MGEKMSNWKIELKELGELRAQNLLSEEEFEREKAIIMANRVHTPPPVTSSFAASTLTESSAADEMGAYKVITLLGEGGMGQVWRAVDTTLDREVAVKILPQVFADDSDRLARIEREAKTLASLNHPNIATVYGLHQSDETRFLAMELVEGEDLQRMLRCVGTP